MEMALITPPIAMNVFVISGMLKDVPMYTIFRRVYVYLIAMAICTALPKEAVETNFLSSHKKEWR